MVMNRTAMVLLLVSAGCGGSATTSVQCLTNSDCSGGQVCNYGTGQCTVSAAGDAGSSACTSTDTWTNYAAATMGANCGSCHGWAGSRTAVVQDAIGIRARIASGAMPPRGGLSQTDRARLLGWIDCGLPQ
jgi:hypothetical protein